MPTRPHTNRSTRVNFTSPAATPGEYRTNILLPQGIVFSPRSSSTRIPCVDSLREQLYDTTGIVCENPETNKLFAEYGLLESARANHLFSNTLRGFGAAEISRILAIASSLDQTGGSEADVEDELRPLIFRALRDAPIIASQSKQSIKMRTYNIGDRAYRSPDQVFGLSPRTSGALSTPTLRKLQDQRGLTSDPTRNNRHQLVFPFCIFEAKGTVTRGGPYEAENQATEAAVRCIQLLERLTYGGPNELCVFVVTGLGSVWGVHQVYSARRSRGVGGGRDGGSGGGGGGGRRVGAGLEKYHVRHVWTGKLSCPAKVVELLHIIDVIRAYVEDVFAPQVERRLELWAAAALDINNNNDHHHHHHHRERLAPAPPATAASRTHASASASVPRAYGTRSTVSRVPAPTPAPAPAPQEEEDMDMPDALSLEGELPEVELQRAILQSFEEMRTTALVDEQEFLLARLNLNVDVRLDRASMERMLEYIDLARD